uniref:Uncharacterized protein n=1 Tax=viral metagenome TaxID=1070528 RepID=A0A6C0CA32_9ZZZZ
MIKYYAFKSPGNSLASNIEQSNIGAFKSHGNYFASNIE